MYILSNFILVLVFLSLILAALLITVPLKVSFAFSSQECTNFNIITTWLKPLLKLVIVKTDKQMFYTLYLLNKKVLTKNLTNKTLNHAKDYIEKIQLTRNLKPHSIDIEASYGFKDPSITGMICGAINLASTYFGINVIYNNPDFNMNYDYFNITGTAQISAISIITTFFKLRKLNLAMQPLNANK